MNSDTISRWLQITANLGVIGGLILVAVQINQSVEITKAQMINDYHIADMQLEMKMMGEEPIQSWVKAVYSPDDLSEEDRAILDRYFNFGFIQIRRLAEMRQYGLAEEDLSQRIDYLGWHLGNAAGRRWWNDGKDRCGDSPDQSCLDFVAQVRIALTNAGIDRNQQVLDRMLPSPQGTLLPNHPANELVSTIAESGQSI